MKKLLCALYALSLGLAAFANPAYNGELISDVNIVGVHIACYHHEQEFSFYGNPDLSLYSSISDLQMNSNPVEINPKEVYSSKEYISIYYDHYDILADDEDGTGMYTKLNPSLNNTQCLKVVDSKNNVYYLEASLCYGTGIWDLLGKINLNGSDCIRHSYSQKAAVWLYDKTPLYKGFMGKNGVSYYDYSKLNLKDGSEHYVDIVEAAVDIKTGEKWIKIESPCGSGWVKALEGNVEKGGIVYYFPDALLHWELIGSHQI